MTVAPLAAFTQIRTRVRQAASCRRPASVIVVLHPAPSPVPGARPGRLPAFIEPSLALLSDKPPCGPNWVHEIKYDEYRIQARIDGGKVSLLTRKSLDWTARFPTIAAALEVLGVDNALLDGETVSEDDHGIPHFSDLQADLKSRRGDRLRYHVFDLLHLDGFDLTEATLLDRKSLLQQTLARLTAGSRLRYSEHTGENSAAMLKHACKMGSGRYRLEAQGSALSVWPRRALAQGQMHARPGARDPGLRAVDRRRGFRRRARARLL